MPSHPDADAFMRNYLRTPQDTTARLVFADWLEETGKPGNRAWAYYIRLKADAVRHPPWSEERRELEREAAGYAPKIRARLTVPAALFVGYPKSLLQLLPGPNITVRLDGFEVPRAVLELVPESVTRENLILPLDRQERVLLIASADPWNREVAEKLQFILNRDVIAVRATSDDIAAAVERLCGQTRAESVDCVFGEFAEPDPNEATSLQRAVEVAEGNEVLARLATLLLNEARNLHADRVIISPGTSSSAVRYRIGGRWSERDSLPLRLHNPLVAMFARWSGIPIGPEMPPRRGTFLFREADPRTAVDVEAYPVPDGLEVDLSLRVGVPG